MVAFSYMWLLIISAQNYRMYSRQKGNYASRSAKNKGHYTAVGNVIEINGKKYDATTGKLLTSTSDVTRSNGTSRTRTSVDGVLAKRKGAHSTAQHAAKPVQKPKTLMRSVVKKPAPVANPKSESKTTSDIKKSAISVPRHRQQAATHIKQSPLISHFGTPSLEGTRVVKKIQHLPVKQQATPAKPTRPSATTAPRITSTSSVHHAPAKEVTTQKRNLVAAKMIENALANATAHEQPLHKKTARHHRIARKLGVSTRVIAISSTVLAGVLLGGFFALQNIPNLSMRVAATRAGFDATLPSYNPAGFSFKGPIQYSPGQVTISFKSNSDDRSYNLTQRSSNWNSEALLANYVSVSGKQYQTYEDRGRTLYIYDGSSATWVDNGIWYQIEGQSKMTAEQLIRVASSM